VRQALQTEIVTGAEDRLVAKLNTFSAWQKQRKPPAIQRQEQDQEQKRA
jgi:hypothetical protein